MLNENQLYQTQIVVSIMSETAILAALVKTTLSEISTQARGLGEGLLTAAPGDGPNNSIQYLLDGSESLAKLAEKCDSLLQVSGP